MAESKVYSQEFLRSKLGPFGILGKLSELRELTPQNQEKFLKVIDAFKAVVGEAITKPGLKFNDLKDIIQFCKDNKEVFSTAISSWPTTNEKEEEKKLRATKALEDLFGSITSLGSFDNIQSLNDDRHKELNIHNKFRNVTKNLEIEESPSSVSIKTHGVEVTLSDNQINIPKGFSSLFGRDKRKIANIVALMAAKKGWKEVTIHIDYQKNPSDAMIFMQALVENGFSLDSIYVQNGAEPRVKVLNAQRKNGEALLSGQQNNDLALRQAEVNQELNKRFSNEQIKNMITETEQQQPYKCKSSYENMLDKLRKGGSKDEVTLKSDLEQAIKDLKTSNAAYPAQSPGQHPNAAMPEQVVGEPHVNRRISEDGSLSQNETSAPTVTL
ncbi:MAG: hypothetical protein AMJ43_05705 [Coxiella sp. DG_40]|nr:MAG: hypothetical protein AMJ43_05705 [Coxiella sp. DG_40]